MESLVSSRLTVLGHPQRLALFRLLMRRYPDHVPATELAQALGLKPNTLSTYVGALMQAGLVTRQRVGTSLRYAIDMESVRDMFDFLLLECCRGRPDVCSHLLPQNTAAPAKRAAEPYNVLFICTGNSARSLMAEAILRREAGDRFRAFSAGTLPRTAPHPIAMEILAQHGHDTSDLTPKNLSFFGDSHGPTFDFVFTVCDQAANETCMAWDAHPITAHWGLPDPARHHGKPEEQRAAFEQTYEALRNRVRALAALPIQSLDRLARQQAVDSIAHLQEGALA